MPYRKSGVLVVARLAAVLPLAALGAAAAQEAPAVAAAAQDAPVVRPGDTVQAEIAGDEPVVETDEILANHKDAIVVGKSYRLEIERAGTYRVELRSPLFDAYLVVRDEEGRIVREDNDGLVGSQSRVVLEAPAGGRFEVEACALHGERGAFELTVLEGEAPALDSNERAALDLEDLRRSVAEREAALGPDSADLARALNRQASFLRKQGDFAAAQELLERSLAIWEQLLGPDHLSVAIAVNNLGTVMMEQGDLAGARPLVERALAIREEKLGPDHPIVASSLDRLGLLLIEQCDFAGARPALERALAIREQAFGPDSGSVASSLTGLGRLLKEQGDYAAARPLLERALAIMEKAGGPEAANVAPSLYNLALLLKDQGDVQGAQSLVERALAITEKAKGPDHPDVARCLDTLGLLLYTQRDFPAARAAYERTLAIRERALGPDSLEVATTLSGLAGVANALGDATAAQSLYERSLAIREKRRGPDDPDVAHSLVNLSRVLQDQGDPAAARALLERALSIIERSLGPQHPDVANCLNSLAVVCLDLGDVDAAVDSTRRAAGVRTDRLAEFLAAATEAESMRYVAATSWQLELLQSPVIIARDPVFSCESLLAWKGQVLRAARGSRAALHAALGTQGEELVGRLRQLSATLSRSASGLGRGEAPFDAAGVQTLSQEYQQVQRELAPLVEGLLPKPPTWKQLRDALPSGAALVDLFVHQVYVPARWDGGTLAEKGHWTELRASAWITRRDAQAPMSVDLGPVATIATALRAALQVTTGARGEPLPGAKEPRASADAELRHLVWDPLADHLTGIETVIVSPDDVLATLAFDSLPGDDGRYLVEDRAFVSLTDPTDLVRLAASARDAAGASRESLLAVGGVDYERGDDDGAGAESAALAGAEPAVAGPVALAATKSENVAGDAATSALPRGGWAASWPPLPATLDEASRVSAAHEAAFAPASGTVLAGAAATEGALKEALPDFGVVHLATHGYFAPDGLPSLAQAAREEAGGSRDGGNAWPPSLDTTVRHLEGFSPGLLSGLVCAGANAHIEPPRDDGYLTAEEVGWLDLSHCDLVVLSACDTGLGRAQSGEGLLGLRRAFLSAGARTVISSLWSVPDQETAELMDLFYRNLWQRQMGKLAALRAAQLEMIARNRERHGGDARPVTWGAFVLDGDWR